MQNHWTADANVQANLTRAKDGTITGTLKIKAANGGPPLILSASVQESALQSMGAAAQRAVTNYHDHLHAQGAASGAANMPAPLVEMLENQYRTLGARPGMARALQRQTEAAGRIIQAARQGDTRAQRVVGMVVALARQGHGPAQRGRAAMSGCASGCASGCVGCPGSGAAVAGPGIFSTAAAMDLHNYYDIISGWGVAPAAAGYTPEKLSFPGVKGMWDNLRPHLGVRPEGANFGMRDALRLGMQSIVQRELAA